jgi:hypothetical protein
MENTILDAFRKKLWPRRVWEYCRSRVNGQYISVYLKEYSYCHIAISNDAIIVGIRYREPYPVHSVVKCSLADPNLLSTESIDKIRDICWDRLERLRFKHKRENRLRYKRRQQRLMRLSHKRAMAMQWSMVKR